MPPEDRRRALVEATLPLLKEHGRAVTTRQIADAAGVAEGTIFRVFESKEALFDAALASAFEPGEFLAALRAIARDQPLRGRMVEMVGLLQARFHEVFGLMRAVGLAAPPEHLERNHDRARGVQQVLSAMVDLVTPDAEELRVPPQEAIRLLRLLTFSGSHQEISHGHPLTPDEIVDTVLYGIASKRHYDIATRSHSC
jgi:AcrR family transcriptional regulator